MEDVEKEVIVEYVDKCITQSAAHWMISQYPSQEQGVYLQHSES